MKKICIGLLAVVGFCNVALASVEDASYQLGAGDSIRIIVYGEEELSFEELLLGEQGLINYPYLGMVKATGLTAEQLENKLAAGLKGDYLINPSVNVSIVGYRPFFIHGEVKKPGGYPYQPGLTLERAVAIAGGYTERASKNKLSINRKIDGVETKLNVTEDSPVKPGDSIYVKDSFF